MAKQNNSTADRELRMTRLFNAPVSLMWQVWTNPEHIKNWWGPNGFTNTISKMEIKTGGEWNLIMHGPDGTDYKNRSVFKEVVENKKIVYEHISGPKYTATITFEEQGDQTLLSWHMLFETKEEFLQVVKTFKADEGLKQNIEKLSVYLNRESSHMARPEQLPNQGIVNTQDNLVFERSYNAPVEKVWAAISDKNEMKKWYFDLAEFKPEPGFQFSFMGGPSPEHQYLHLCEVMEVIPNKKLSYSWRYDGYEGNSLVSFELFAEGNTTKLILTHSGLHTFPASNPHFAKGNFNEGWTMLTGTLLKNYLETV